MVNEPHKVYTFRSNEVVMLSAPLYQSTDLGHGC
jgi:hypothetical protein